MSVSQLRAQNSDELWIGTLHCSNIIPAPIFYTYSVTVGITGCINNNNYTATFQVTRNNNTVLVTVAGFTGAVANTVPRNTINTMAPVLQPADIPTTQKWSFLWMTSNNSGQSGSMSVLLDGTIVFSLGVTGGLNYLDFFSANGFQNGWVSGSLTYVLGV